MIVPLLVQGNPGASTFKFLCKITKLLEEDPWIQKIKGNLQLSQCSPSDASIVWRLGCYNTNARSHAQNMPHFARHFFGSYQGICHIEFPSSKCSVLKGYVCFVPFHILSSWRFEMCPATCPLSAGAAECSTSSAECSASSD